MDHPLRQTFLGDNHPAIGSTFDAMLGKASRCRYEVGYEPDRRAWDYQRRHYLRVKDYVDRVLAGQVPGV